jgi:hypothetical protein
MYLNLDSADGPMKLVYELSAELRKDVWLVSAAQALTLNPDRPQLGLKGRHGLFGSEAWWQNIRNGTLRIREISGIIEETVYAGQDARWGDSVNSFRLKLDDGAVVLESIYANQKQDRKLFVPGARVAVAYVLDELKRQPAPDGGVNYSKSVLEMAVSGKKHG